MMVIDIVILNNTEHHPGVADRALLDIITSAKIRRRLDVITQLLRQCQKLGPIADQSNVVTSCLEAIVDSWLLTCKFSTRSAG